MSKVSYARRAAEVEAARRAVSQSFGAVTNRHEEADPATLAWRAALERFNAAMAALYSSEFWQAFERLQRISRFYAGLDGAGDKVDRFARPLTRGDARALETAIEFLEGDPMCFRSGYVKAALIKFINRLPLCEDKAERLRAVALHVVDTRCTVEFRAFCRLARKVDAPGLRAGLEARANSADRDVARRARWMAEAVARLDRARARKYGGGEGCKPGRAIEY